jgi:signal transduction histidine kinase
MLTLHLFNFLQRRHAKRDYLIRKAERERIARVLHDTFLQGIHAMVLKFDSLLSEMPVESPGRAKLESTLLFAEQLMQEGRDEIAELRSMESSEVDLGYALNKMGVLLLEDCDIRFKLCCDSSDKKRALFPQVHRQAYFIGLEAVKNAFHHAKSRTIQIVLSYGKDQFTMRVINDGKGMPSEIIAAGGRKNHWGLYGFFERAKLVGGEIAIESDAYGSQVTLKVCASKAYSA